MIDFPTTPFGLQNAIILDKIDIYKNIKQPNYVPDEPLKRSELLGTPVFSDLTLKGAFYTDNDGNRIQFDDVYFDTVIITISQEKRIISTDIQGRDSSINEYIGLSDYQVTVNCVLPFNNGVYDRTVVGSLKQLLIAPISIKCVSWFLQIWDIDEVIIKGYDIPQIMGQYSQQPITLNARSNKSLELTQYNV